AAAAGGPRVGFPPPAWRGGTTSTVQGGGLRLENFPDTLPGNILLLRLAYRDPLLAGALWGLVLALILPRRPAPGAIPFSVGALVLYGFWSRPESRYLIGVYLFVPMLIVEGALGTLDLVRRFVRRSQSAALLGASVAVLALAAAVAAILIGQGRSGGLPI